MPLAVTLRFDAVGSSRIEAMMAMLAPRPPDAYPPHLTLAVFTREDGANELARDLEAKAVGWPSIDVTFCGFGLFPSQPAVLWLALVPTQRLIELNTELTATVAIDGVHQHYRADTWTPHVTLATELTSDRAADAIRMLSTKWSSFTARLQRVDLVRFQPVSVLWQAPLASLRSQ